MVYARKRALAEEGTEIDASITNTLPHSLLVSGLSTRGIASADTFRVASGATRKVRFTAGAQGTYYYRGVTEVAERPDGPAVDAELSGAVQQMGNGETYDFEFMPTLAGDLRFTVSSGVGVLLATMPIRVR